MPKQLLPSRYKATVTTRVNELRQMLADSDAKIDNFQTIDDIDEAFKASKDLRIHASKIKAKLTTFQTTWDKWCTEIEAITNQTLKDSEQDEQDNHKLNQSFDECNLESEVCEMVAMINEVVEAKTRDLENLAKFSNIKAKKANTDLQNQINKTLIDDETKAKKLLIEDELKAKQAVIDTIANEAKAKQSLVETIENEAKAKQALLDRETAARQQAIDDEQAVKKELLDEHLRIQRASIQSATYQPYAGPAGDQSLISNQNIIVQSHNQTLPKLELPSFDGTLWKYAEFEQMFTTLIDDDQSLTDIQRHQYLRQCLKGEAREVIQFIPKTAECYAEAKALLKETYHKPMRCKQAIEQRLRDLSCNTDSLQSQLSMTRQAKAIVKEMEKIVGEGKVDILQNSHVRKYSEAVQRRAQKKLRNNQNMSIFDTLKVIEDFLEEQIDIETAIQPSSVNRSYDRKPYPNNRDNRNTSNAQASSHNTPANRNSMCVFCDANHNSENCSKSKDERFEALKAKSICGRCLLTGHNFRACQARCAKCNGKHHEFVCKGSRNSQSGNQNTTTNNAPRHSNPNARRPASVLTANSQGGQTVAAIQLEQPAQPNQQTVASIHIQPSSDDERSALISSLIKKPQLFLAKVTLVNPISKQEKEVDAFVDPGAQPTVMTETLARELNLPVIATVEVDIVVPGAMKLVNRVYDFSEVQLKCENTDMTIRAARFKHDITGPIQKRALSKKDKDFVRRNKIHLSDSPNREELITPQLLIGMEDAAKLFAQSKRPTRSLPSGYLLQQSGIGYLVGGSPKNSESTVPAVVLSDHRTTNHDKCPDIQLNFLSFNARIERFLGMDEAAQGIETTEREIRKLEDAETDKYFDDTIYKDGSNYVVKYRLKDNWQELPDNRQLAYRRLESEVRKLKGNQHYLDHYDKIFQEQLAADQIEVVDEKMPTPHLVHYLAHAPVLRPEKPTTPLRVVYDASAKLKGKICLNDAIFQGPNGLEQIPALLLRVLSKKNLIIADVEKAFLQVRVHESQRDMLRFIWLKDKNKGVTKDNLVTYRFKVTPFGVNQSPYILGKVIQHHLKSIVTADPTELYIISQLQRNIYVDNVLFCADDAKREYYDTSKRIFDDMGMNLREYISSDQSFNAFIASSDRGKDSEQKLLGILWDPASDTFKLKSKLGNASSKRQALSEVASQYDPLGWLSPLFLNGKLFVQELWNEKNLKWDDFIRPELKAKWEQVKQATEGATVAIPRYCHLDGPIIRLVVFSDASKRASGACVYNGNPTEQACRLLISRTRLAPKKFNSTIPKLELEGCVIGFNLVQYTVNALAKEHPDSEIHVFPFCDSTIAIHWMSAQTQHPLGPYVINRVKKYKKICDELTESGVQVHPLRYVNTKDNPADFLTRGLDAVDVNNPSHPWWAGPQWLAKDQSEWPQTILPAHHDELTLCSMSWAEERIQVESRSNTSVIDTFRFSTLERLIKTVVCIHRYIKRLNQARLKRRSEGNPERCSVLSPHTPHSHMSFYSDEERKHALLTLVRMHQNSAEIEKSEIAKGNHIAKDEHGIWRGNNIRFRDVLGIQVNPIFLSGKNSHLPELLCHEVHHNLNHAGVNTIVNEIKRKYWIPRIRSIAKRVANQCIDCRKANNFPYKYPETVPLPEGRTTHIRPFENTGLDFIGPFKDKQDQNIYILLLTCFSTRAIHLETVNSMSTTSMINALKRFVSRRGLPSFILSDKAPTFRTADEMLKKLKITDCENFQTELTNQGIQWKFTTAHAPWQGGLYERLVGSVKKAMNKTIGRKKLTPEDFSTLACEIEASVNCRPLTYAGTDDEKMFCPSVIRPIDFLCPGISLGLRFDTDNDEYIPRSELTTRDQVLKQLHRNETMVENMISIWMTSYIASLRDSDSKNPLQSYRASQSTPKLGEVVLIVDESGNMPRNTWPLAVIEEIKGHSIKLRTVGGRKIERPPNLIIPLELSNDKPQRVFKESISTTTNGLSDKVHRHAAPPSHLHAMQLHSEGSQSNSPEAGIYRGTPVPHLRADDLQSQED